jgi:hypothetical protein
MFVFHGRDGLRAIRLTKLIISGPNKRGENWDGTEAVPAQMNLVMPDLATRELV